MKLSIVFSAVYFIAFGLGVLVALCLSGCTIDTSGLPSTSEVWRAWAWCGRDEKALALDVTMQPDDAVDLQNGWSCMVYVDQSQGWTTCRKEGLMVEQAVECDGAGRGTLFLGECAVQLACDGPG